MLRFHGNIFSVYYIVDREICKSTIGRELINVCVSMPAAVARVCRDVGPYVYRLLALILLPSFLIPYVTLFYCILYCVMLHSVMLYCIISV